MHETIQTVNWPERKEIFGVKVTPTTYEEAISFIIDAAEKGVAACIDFMPVHGLMTAVKVLQFNTAINEMFDMVCPDGQPVRWALNKFHNCNLTNRVYGPTLTIKLISEAAQRSIPVFFYGSSTEVLAKLRKNLLLKFPDLIISGMESPPFRELSEQEGDAAAQRIVDSGAKILFIGLGCPKQELWAAKMKEHIPMPMLCVGAAFDFHAGTLKQAPSWMQKRGLEWLYRFCKEPKRLWKRYMLTNSTFMVLCVKRFFSR